MAFLSYPESEVRQLSVGTSATSLILSVENYARVCIGVKNNGTTALNQLAIALRGHPGSQWVTFINTAANYTTPVAPLVRAADSTNTPIAGTTLAGGGEVTLFFDLRQYPASQLRFTASVASGTTELTFYLFAPTCR